MTEHKMELNVRLFQNQTPSFYFSYLHIDRKSFKKTTIKNFQKHEAHKLLKPFRSVE